MDTPGELEPEAGVVAPTALAAAPAHRLRLRRLPALLFGLLAQLVAFGALLVLVGALTGIGPGPHLDAGASSRSVGAALAIDLALLAAFALPHSALARDGVKARLARVLPSVLVRTLFVLVAGLTLALLIHAWQPLPVALWHVEAAGARAALLALALAGWFLALIGLLAVDHREVFGLSAVWRYARGVPEPAPRLVVDGIYARLRQPINLGTLIALWATPDLTQGRLLLAATLSLYVGIGSVLAERDLARRFGAEWLAYRRAVPALLPRLRAWKGEPQRS